jgi:hypothetical protein
MPKYNITATKIEYFEIEVEAENKEEAIIIANERKNLFKFLRESEIEILENSCTKIKKNG